MVRAGLVTLGLVTALAAPPIQATRTMPTMGSAIEPQQLMPTSRVESQLGRINDTGRSLVSHLNQIGEQFGLVYTYPGIDAYFGGPYPCASVSYLRKFGQCAVFTIESATNVPNARFVFNMEDGALMELKVDHLPLTGPSLPRVYLSAVAAEKSSVQESLASGLEMHAAIMYRFQQEFERMGSCSQD